jgi:predicted RecA/RadA family phage recombinase
MPFQEGLLVSTLSAQANANLSTSQFYAVSLATAGSGTANQPVPGVIMELAVSGSIFAGILQDNPVAGQAGSIQVSGITLAAIAASQTVTAGNLLYINSSSQLVTGTGYSSVPVAQAMESCASNASVSIISVKILPVTAAL